MIASIRSIVHLLALLLVVGPLLTSSAHVVFDEHCDHHLPIDLPAESSGPFSPDDDECVFLAYLLHAIPLVTEASAPVPEGRAQAEIVPPAPIRREISLPATGSAQRAPPRVAVA